MVPEVCPLGYDCEDRSRCGFMGIGLEEDSLIAEANAAGLVVERDIDGIMFLGLCSGFIDREPNDQVTTARRIIGNMHETVLRSMERGLRINADKAAASANDQQANR